MLDFSVNTTLNNAASIDNDKVQAILSESLPLSDPSPLLPEGKFIYLIMKITKQFLFYYNHLVREICSPINYLNLTYLKSKISFLTFMFSLQ